MDSVQIKAVVTNKEINMSGRRAPRQQYTTAQLKRMSNKQLKTAGFIRVAGYTRTDGTVVKTHIRELSTTEKSFRDQQAAREVAGNVIDFVPVIGDAKAFKESGEAFMEGNKLEGAVLGVAGTIGLVPFVGDFIAKPLKILAKTLRTPNKSTHDLAIDRIRAGGELKFDESIKLFHKPTRIPSSKIVETTKQTAKREELYKQEDKINLKINKLLNPNYGATGDLASPLVKVKYNKLDAQRKTLQVAREKADTLAYGGKSSKELKEAKSIYDAADTKNRSLLLKARELRTQMKTTTNPTVKAAIKRKHKKILSEREKLFNNKEYFDAQKIVIVNNLL